MAFNDDRGSHVELLEESTVIHLTGAWTATEAGELHKLFASIGSDARVVIDLRDARYVDSTILTEFVLLRKRLDAAGGSIALLANDGAVKRILQVTNLDKAFSMNRGPLARAHMNEPA